MRRAEDLVLRLRGEVRGELVRVAGPQLPRPAHARVSAGDLDRDAEERLEVGLEPPVALGAQQVVEPGVAEGLVDLGRVRPQLRVCRLQLAETPAQRTSAG